MKRYRVYVVLSVVLVLLLTVSPGLTVLAQDGGPEMNCTGLSDADCQILKDATAAMQSVKSFSIPAWAVDVNMDAGPESITFATNGHGAVVLPETLVALMPAFQALSTNYADLDAMIAFYQQFTSAMLLQALQESGLYMVIENYDLQAPDQSQAGSADLIYKDQTLYVRLESPAGEDAWFGEKLEPTPDDLAEIDDSIAEMLTELQSEEFQEAWAQMSEFTGLSEQLNALVSQYIVTTRGADADMGGQAMVVFTTTFDLKGLLADPELSTLIMSFVSNPALTELGTDMEDLEGLNETQVQFVLMTLGLILKDTSFSAEQWVGADDMFFHKFAMDGSLNVDLSLLGTESEVQAVTVTGSFALEMADFNTDVLAGVEVPTDHRPLDDTSDFLMGDPGMIEQQLELGQTFAASFSSEGDDQDIYGLPLEAGQTVEIELTSDDYPYLSLYGPDGFLIGEYDTYDDEPMTFTADGAGTYLIVVEAYWELDYEITIRAQ